MIGKPVDSEFEVFILQGGTDLVRLRRTTCTHESVLWREFIPEFLHITEEDFVYKLQNELGTDWTVRVAGFEKDDPFSYYLVKWVADIKRVQLKYCPPPDSVRAPIVVSRWRSFLKRLTTSAKSKA
jgi:hypothetical protein